MRDSSTAPTWALWGLARTESSREPVSWFNPDRIVNPEWAVGVQAADESVEPSLSELARDRGPYDACVPAGITAAAPSLSHEAYAHVGEALSILGRIDGLMQQHPLREMVAKLCLVVEALASSSMENIRSTPAAVLEAISSIEEPESLDRATALVVDQFASLSAAEELSDLSTAQQAHRLHSILLGRSRPEVAGKVREVPVWIGDAYARTPHGASYVAPVSGRVDSFLEDLDVFMERTDVASVVQAAIAHAQFETIHPYVDGNGRVGRSMFGPWLRKTEAIAGPVSVPVSYGLFVRRESYVDALVAYRHGDLSQIVSVSTISLIDAAQAVYMIADQLTQIRERWTTELNVRPDALAWRLIDSALAGVTLSANVVARDHDVSYPTANAALAALVEIGALSPISKQRRNRLFIATEVTELLSGLLAENRRGSRFSG